MLWHYIREEGVVCDNIALSLLHIFLLKDVLPKQTNIWLKVILSIDTTTAGDNNGIQGTFIGVRGKQLLLLMLGTFTQWSWVRVRSQCASAGAGATKNMKVAI